jgi:CrcB protein
MNNWTALIIGGIAGTIARYLLGGVFIHKTGMDFPYGTLVINLLGCFLVGFFDVMIERKFTMPSTVRLMMITGFCGGFTTFSAYILESYALIKSGALIKAFLYLFGSISFGLILFRVGMLTAALL